MTKLNPFAIDTSWINDDFALVRDFERLLKPTYLSVYDPSEYDLVPKPETAKRLIKAKEDELNRLKENFKEREKSLTAELDQLRQKQLNP